VKRLKAWIPVIVLNLVGALAVWLTASLLEEIHELVGEDVFRIDTILMVVVRTLTPAALEPFLIFLTELLIWGRLAPVIAVILFLLLVVLLWRRLWGEAVGLLIALLIPSASVAIAKLVFQRVRPDVSWAFIRDQEFSFPSGHAAGAVVIYGMMAYLLWRMFRRTWVGLAAWATAFVLIAATGYSRVYLGAHYPTDVAAGYGVGLIWLITGIITTETLYAFRGRREQPSTPTDSPAEETSADLRGPLVPEQEVRHRVRT
jgi:membrane-associated phospholipid phosphatase